MYASADEDSVSHPRSLPASCFDRIGQIIRQMNGMESGSDSIHVLRDQALLLSKSGEEIRNVSSSFRILGKEGQGGRSTNMGSR